MSDAGSTGDTDDNGHGVCGDRARPVNESPSVMRVVGAVIDSFGVVQEARKSAESGNWDNTRRQAATVAGGWIGAALVGGGAGALSVTVFSSGDQVTALVTSVSAVVVGYVVGSWLGRSVYDTTAN